MSISMSSSSLRTFEAARDPLSSDYEVDLGLSVIPMEVGNQFRNTSTNELFRCTEVDTGVSASFTTVPDLETGTFTPEIQFGGASTGITYSSQSGSYVRVGNAVTLNIFIALSNKGSSTGDATIVNLPFANGSAHAAFTTYTDDVSLSLTYSTFGSRIAPAQQFIRLFETGSLLTLQNLDDENFQNSSQVFVSGTYFM
jgi:hypothetical protein